MQIQKVQIQGNDNFLRYAIKNKADLFNDYDVLDFISGDTVVMVTLSDVNFYELCRLSHHYRKKIRVLEEDRIGDIPSNYFDQMFPGIIENKATGEKIKSSQIVKETCDGFMNIALQMEADEDIIPSWAGRLFIPMAYRKLKIIVPISFFELIRCMQASRLLDAFQDEHYQEKLDSTLYTDAGREVLDKLLLYFSDIVYRPLDNDRVIQLAKLFMFQSLGKNKTKKLYHYTPIGFSRYNEFTGLENRVRFFNGNPEKISEEIKVISTLKTPLKVDFAVELPLHQLQVLERTFTEEELGVDFLSSPSEILTTPIRFEDFIIPEHASDIDNSESQRHMVEHEAAISAYRDRIRSASDNTIAAAAILNPVNRNHAKDQSLQVLPEMVILYPAIASTRACLTLELEAASRPSKYKFVNDDLNRSMLSEMVQTMIEINNSIVNAS